MHSLKPENVLINFDGYIKLADFGLSELNYENLKTTSSFSGTAEYISPEQITNNQSGFISDWWSFGIIVYEMLAGRPPFLANNNPDELFRLILKGNYKIPVYFTLEASDLISRLLMKNPTKRLGFNGANEIKEHPFFKSIDFNLIIQKKIDPPFLPRLKSLSDVKYFDQNFTNMQPVDSYDNNDLLHSLEDPFCSKFSFNPLSKKKSNKMLVDVNTSEGEVKEDQSQDKEPKQMTTSNTKNNNNNTNFIGGSNNASKMNLTSNTEKASKQNNDSVNYGCLETDEQSESFTNNDFHSD